MWCIHGVWHLYLCGVKMTPDINPLYAGLERSCHRDSKNVSYVNVGLASSSIQSDLKLKKREWERNWDCLTDWNHNPKSKFN